MLHVAKPRPRPELGAAARLLMSGGLAVAAWIHLILVPEHMAESWVLGLGFLAAAVAQAALAVIVVRWPREWNLWLVVAVNVTLVAVYAYAVVVGLPFGAAAEGGMAMGGPEPIDAFGAVSKVAELVSVAAALAVLGRARQARRAFAYGQDMKTPEGA